MPELELNVFLDGTFIGVVSQNQSGNVGFTYDESYRRRIHATPLSLSMPVTRASHPARVVLPFLQGLLPDSAGRLDELGREFHTSAANPLQLLRHIGGDVAGAVQILPPDVSPSDAGQRQRDIQRLDDAALTELIADVVDNADTWGTRDDGRWSLAGAQPKLALFRDDDGWGIPRDATPTTHILKPAVLPYVEHDVNEYVTMTAARAVGLRVADAGLLTTDRGDRVFVAARYDRRLVGDRWQRRHQEDFCQALSVDPARKYQSDGGPGFAAMAQLIDTFPGIDQRRASQRALFDAMVFNVSAANTDAHAKNYSILLDAERAELAPLYDLGTHLAYPSTRPLTSAMKVGDEYRLDAIGIRDFVGVGRKLRIPADEAESRVNDIRSGLAAAFAGAAAQIAMPDERAVATRIAESVADYAAARGWID
ncbi:type II toxin-antitoxin system HipA family toxin [Agromyces protaetiae]|uniref:Type II toxin-antitoxin system HipA family toxin n=1 Tax=Agromyces protaetiae TaxID=2509455 RepID=A0A4P6F9C4_9MICO|nr:HipA domain-containing protein [Agromyces protaetiae]QAY72374.1 type II toxin-antitoxin system HipA family toxin [Agromyces protaetiae]